MTSLKKDVFGLTFVNVYDFGLQFLVPMVVARVLSPGDFGSYRMCWLVAMTVYSLAVLHIPHSLSYFLPRVGREDKIKYIVSTLFLLSLLSVMAAAVVNPWFPLLPVKWIHVGQPDWYFPVFIGLWVMGGLNDYLAIGDGRVHWQIRAILFLATARSLLISLTAWLTHDLSTVLLAMLAFVSIKALLPLIYMARFYRTAWLLDKTVLRQQFKYALPFGIAQGFYDLRLQSEQWMVAAMFNVRQFAAFSLGGMMSPLFYMLRQSINNAVLPRLSALHAEHKIAELALLNKKATTMIGFFVIPSACILWMYSKEVITVIYTAQYLDAVDVMRVYMIGILPQVFESHLLLRVCGFGGFGLKLHMFMLPLALTCSYTGIQLIGLPGGALGSVLTSLLSHLFSVMRVSRHLGAGFFELYDIKRFFLYLFIAMVAINISVYVADYWVDEYLLSFWQIYNINISLARGALGGGYAMLVFISICWLSKLIPSGFK